MPDALQEWLLNLVSMTAVLTFIGYKLRDTAVKFLSRAVEHRFEKQLETFKSEIRDNEKELEQIRTFLVSARRERDSAIQARRFEAAENLLRARHSLSQFSMLVEYMKILNGTEIIKEGDNPDLIDFINTLIKPFDLDEKIKSLGDVDKATARLYLSDKTLKYFDAYQNIILHAAMMMKMYSIPLRNKGDLVKAGNLAKTITDIVPSAKEGFERYGESYAYYWAQYFYDEVLRSLRHEVSGADDLSRDTQSIARLALESRQAQINIRTYLEKSSLPTALMKEGEAVQATPPAPAR